MGRELLLLSFILKQGLGSNITSKEKSSRNSVCGRRILTAKEAFDAEFLLLLQKINLNLIMIMCRCP